MHLIDKDPMPAKKTLSTALKNRTEKMRGKYISNPILRENPPKMKVKPREVQIRTTPARRMRQFGDKGYKPATGEGTSY